ncbi:MAG TPA: CBS domain-containing protein [Roseiflexaceae bacterium]|nr:CBS domain-containing protein [Roseiflexaceae bacterium]
MKQYRVADWMSAPAIVVSPAASLAEAQHLMERRHVRRLPVVERGQLLGIITRGDLRAAKPSESSLSTYEWRALLDKVTVAEAMTRAPATIGPEAPVLAAAELMLERKISGLPVVDGGRVVGVITESDLFRLLIAELTGVEQADAARAVLICHHCGAVHRGRSLDALGPDDECWRCHYHLHRCENCRYFDGIACMLSRVERHEAIPGRSCPAFAYLPPRAVSADR